MLRIDRDRQGLKLFLVHAPVDAERLYPVQDLLHIGLGQGKSPLQHGQIQQCTDLAGIESALGQAKQGKKSLRQSPLIRKSMFGERERNVSSSGRRAEDRFDQRRIVLQPRDEHPDIGRRKAGIALKGIQQLVVHRLDLAHRAMTDMHLDRTVISGEFRRRYRTTVKQFRHIRLDHTQQRVAAGYLIGLRLNSVQTNQLPQCFAAQPPHRGQQAVTLIQIGICCFPLHGQQPGALTVTHDLGPITLAEIEVIQVDLGMPGDSGNEFEKCG